MQAAKAKQRLVDFDLHSNPCLDFNFSSRLECQTLGCVRYTCSAQINGISRHFIADKKRGFLNPLEKELIL